MLFAKNISTKGFEMTISNGLINAIHCNRIVFSQRILRTLGAILIVCGLLGAVNALNAKEWQVTTAQKQGGFVGAELEFAPWWGRKRYRWLSVVFL